MRLVIVARSWATALVLVLLALGAASCADLRLAKFRNDRLLDEYHYALGESYVDAGGLKFCYQERGDGPVILILPGLGTNIDFWQLNIPVLAERFQVIALDLPGLGKSDKPDASYDLPWMCDRILAFMDAKRIDRASIIGGSLGGHLGLLLALNHPERVEKLIMMGSVGAWPRPNFVLDAGLKLLWNEAIVVSFVRAHWPEIFHLMFIRDSDLTRSLFRYQMARRARGDRFAPEGRALARALRSIFYNSCRDRLATVGVPVLLIWGESDEIHPPEEGLYMRRHIPDARIAIVRDAAHEVMVDQPETFNRLVQTFLETGTAGIDDSLGVR
jgi:2-hydroxymuconate-semialdehyde hydrolase